MFKMWSILQCPLVLEDDGRVLAWGPAAAEEANAHHRVVISFGEWDAALGKPPAGAFATVEEYDPEDPMLLATISDALVYRNPDMSLARVGLAPEGEEPLVGEGPKRAELYLAAVRVMPGFEMHLVDA